MSDDSVLQEINKVINSLTPKNRVTFLETLQKRVEKDKRDILIQTKKDFEKRSAELGFTLNDVVNASNVKNKATINPPLYRNPDNALETWTGRGSVPKWVRALDDKGVSRETYLISELDKPYVYDQLDVEAKG